MLTRAAVQARRKGESISQFSAIELEPLMVLWKASVAITYALCTPPLPVRSTSSHPRPHMFHSCRLELRLRVCTTTCPVRRICGT